MANPMKDKADPLFSDEAVAKRKARKPGGFQAPERKEPYFGGGGGGRRIGTKAVDTAKGIPALVTRDNRTLTTFLIASFVIVGASQLADGEVPSPGSFVSIMVVFLVLGFAAEFSPQTNRVATAFGGLVLLAIFLAHGSGLVKALSVLTPEVPRAAPEDETIDATDTPKEDKKKGPKSNRRGRNSA